MPKLKLYLDTSVVGAVYDTEDPSRVDVTKKLLNVLKGKDEFLGFISNILIEELERAPEYLREGLKEIVKELDVNILYETEECVELVTEYLENGILSEKYRDDARHIAVAVVNNMDTIVTWNCRHMANISQKRAINGVNMLLGYRQIDIVTPLEVVGYD